MVSAFKRQRPLSLLCSSLERPLMLCLLILQWPEPHSSMRGH